MSFIGDSLDVFTGGGSGTKVSGPTREEFEKAIGALGEIFPELEPFEPDPFSGDTNPITPRFRELQDLTFNTLTGDTPFSRALKGDYDFRYFDEGVVDPTLALFERDVVPQIKEAGSQFGGRFGGAVNSRLAQSRTDLGRELSRARHAEYNNIYNRGLAATGALPGISTSMFLLPEQQRISNEINVWATEQGLNAQAAQSQLAQAGFLTGSALQYFGLQQEADQFNAGVQAQENAAQGQLLGTGLGVLGGFFGGPPGAIAGGAIGSTAANSSVPTTSSGYFDTSQSFINLNPAPYKSSLPFGAPINNPGTTDIYQQPVYYGGL